MKAIMVMFDSLNRHMLSAYGCDWTHTPNFQRLAERTVTFDNCYAGSLPCMPARRELHTGRYNFLHRSWGPIEPFDDSMPEILKKNGVYTHLVSDHYHYWEDGGCTYHNRYSSWEIVRGQEGDLWKGHVKDPDPPEALGKPRRQDWVNREYMQEEHEFPQAQTFARGMEFIRKNVEEDNWFLQIETFDPHEPFYAPQNYRDLYPHDYNGPHFDWSSYDRVTETPEQVQHCRYEYAALLSMCDAYLGKILELMDKLDLWKDTMLIVNTDHGHLLGEHDWWGKIIQPFYNEIVHMPLFIWDPHIKKTGARRKSLVQTIDLPPTLLEFFDVSIPKDMLGKPLKATIADDIPLRDTALFGMHSGHINITDGTYVYMRAPENRPPYEYTLMPTHLKCLFAPGDLREAELVAPFSFTKGCPLLKVKSSDPGSWLFPPGGAKTLEPLETLLFNLADDPAQDYPIQDEQVEARLIKKMKNHLHENDAPAELYQRIGL
jgi:arylsulfatase A-like enzyme